jgi:hypothetical protein
MLHHSGSGVHLFGIVRFTGTHREKLDKVILSRKDSVSGMTIES